METEEDRTGGPTGCNALPVAHNEKGRRRYSTYNGGIGGDTGGRRVTREGSVHGQMELHGV